MSTSYTLRKTIGNGVQFCRKKAQRLRNTNCYEVEDFVTSLSMERDKKGSRQLKHVARAYSRWKCEEGREGNIDYLSAVVKFDFALRP
jgi:hypothetical protein